MSSCISSPAAVGSAPPSSLMRLVVAKTLAIRNGNQGPSNALVAMIRWVFRIIGALTTEGEISVAATARKAGQSVSKSTGAHPGPCRDCEQKLLAAMAEISQAAAHGALRHAPVAAAASAARSAGKQVR